MATPTIEDIEVWYKVDETLSGVINDDNGDPVNLTGGGSINVEFHVAAEYGGTPVLSKSLAGTTISFGDSSGTAGDYTLDIADSDWTSLPLSGSKRIWHHTVWHTDSSGVRVAKVLGTFTVNGTVSS